MSREFDVLLWGATGWTGVHLAEYFAKTYPLNSADVRWAMCGRSAEKLARVVARLESQGFEWAKEIECIQVDNMDSERVHAVVKRATAVATVVGPYAQYGEPLVKACVMEGTHYCDITGETPWIKDMIDKYHEEAEQNGVFIVPSCGFDSIPADLGVYVMAKYMREELNQKCKNVRGYLVRMDQNNLSDNSKAKGGGGTLASLMNAASAKFQAFSDPYYLTGKKDVCKGDKGHFPQMFVGYEGRLEQYCYTTHFPMAFINEKTVRRSNFLLKYLYGLHFSYHEALGTKGPLRALLASISMSFAYLLLFIPFMRRIIKRLVPQPSTWPPDKTSSYKPGYFEYRFVGESENGESCTGVVKGCDEAGWTETAKMLGESALTLCKDLKSIKDASGIEGGVVTPAVLGSSLVDRLTTAGMEFSAKRA